MFDGNLKRRVRTRDHQQSIDTWLKKIVGTRGRGRLQKGDLFALGKVRIRESPKTNIVETKEVAA